MLFIMIAKTSAIINRCLKRHTIETYASTIIG